MTDLHDLADAAVDETTFTAFIAALAADREAEIEVEKTRPSNPYGPGAKGWENRTIDAFLEAAGAWAEASINGLEYYAKPTNPWTRCAQILLMGKHYE